MDDTTTLELVRKAIRSPLRLIRESRHMSIDQAVAAARKLLDEDGARKLYIDNPVLSRVERGLLPLSPDLRELLSRVYEVPIDAVVGEWPRDDMADGGQESKAS